MSIWALHISLFMIQLAFMLDFNYKALPKKISTIKYSRSLHLDKSHISRKMIRKNRTVAPDEASKSVCAHENKTF